MMITNSQASQDIFVLTMLQNKTHGVFVEIGANEPINYCNNTYVLEKYYGWRGLMVEYNRDFEKLYIRDRPNSSYILNDARKINYREYLDTNNYPTNIDYLQIDLDVNNRSTLDILEIFQSTVFDKYKFATVTFEHDIYDGNWFNTREASREIFNKAGYFRIFSDVQVCIGNNKFAPFEDWYVHPTLVDMSVVAQITSTDSKTHLQIRDILNTIQKTTFKTLDL